LEGEKTALMVDINTTDLSISLAESRLDSARAEARREAVPSTAARIMGAGSVSVMDTGLARCATACTPETSVSFG
jgi:hypothetical protein